MPADVCANASSKRGSPPIAWSASAWIRTSTRCPPICARDPQPLLAFNRRIVDATLEHRGRLQAANRLLQRPGQGNRTAASIRYIRERAPAALVILDAKRSDIGNTAEAYAREAFERYGADAVTVNPYMGEDSVRPFLARPDRGAMLLCRTSNPGARDFQDLLVDGEPLYKRVAERAAARWNEHRNLMLVVGATYPAEMAELRRAHPALWFLVPGIGAQGGDLDDTLAAGLNAAGAGLLINSSRGIIYAGGGESGADPRRSRGAARGDQPQTGSSRRRRDVAEGPQPPGCALGNRAAKGSPVLAGRLGFAQRGIRSRIHRPPFRVIGRAQRKSQTARESQQTLGRGEGLFADLAANALRHLVQRLLVDVSEAQYRELPPPRHAAMSEEFRSCPARILPVARSTSSPTSWPCSSLICLKLSRSSRMSP